MKIGYPCINRSLGCTPNRTFRLRNYSVSLLKAIIAGNLDCLLVILKYNLAHGIFFFRIGSGLVPFASHTICRFDWQGYYQKTFEAIGDFIRSHDMRISMHPDQFTLINSPDKEIFRRSVKELAYHASVLELLGLDDCCKMQIHIGGVYNDKPKSLARFIARYKTLPKNIKKHLVIENDDRLYSVKDCMLVYQETGVPVLFDVFHHNLNNNGESVDRCLSLITKTWEKRDGLAMVDYSSQQKGLRPGAHTMKLSGRDFKKFLHDSRKYNFDLMLEIKDKEKSAIRALRLASQDKRLR
jgi:UV DNA damage endonuclease